MKAVLLGGARIPSVPALALFVLVPLLAACGGSSEDSDAEISPVPHVHHFAWVSGKIARGGQPMGEEAFRELAAAGIKTIINVDGARPDVETAAKYGMRYVHIPFGYDGVPEEQRERLAKTVREIEGPFFVHCHHGKHRGPVGAVIAQMTLGGMTHEEAVAELTRAGTAEKYRGLWACAREFEPPSVEETDSLEYDFPEVAPVPALADAMARVDRIWDNLKDCRRSEWGTPENHPDIDPPHEALQLLEHFTEMGRTDEVKEKDEKFLKLLADAVAGSKELEAELRKDPRDLDAADRAFKSVDQSCAACHSEYRNNR